MGKVQRDPSCGAPSQASLTELTHGLEVCMGGFMQFVESDSLCFGLGLKSIEVLVHPSLLSLANLFACPLFVIGEE